MTTRMAPRKPGKTVHSRVEYVLTQAGQFPNALAIGKAVLQLSEKEVKKVIKRIEEMPEEQRKKLGIAANLLLSVLENRVKQGRKR